MRKAVLPSCFTTLVFCLLLIQRVDAVAPHLIVLQSDSSSRPIFVSAPAAIFEFMCAIDGEGPIPPDLEGRRFVGLSAFWGPRWVNYWSDPLWQANIRTDQAEQHGRIYPAVSNRRPIFVGTRVKAEPTAPPKELKEFAYGHELSAECAATVD